MFPNFLNAKFIFLVTTKIRIKISPCYLVQSKDCSILSNVFDKFIYAFMVTVLNPGYLFEERGIFLPLYKKLSITTCQRQKKTNKKKKIQPTE